MKTAITEILGIEKLYRKSCFIVVLEYRICRYIRIRYFRLFGRNISVIIGSLYKRTLTCHYKTFLLRSLSGCKSFFLF